MKQTVLITGCSSGFGAAAAKLYAARGWNVIATMRNPADGGALLALENVEVIALDVQSESSIDAAINAGIARFGRIDVLVNNAGFGLFGIFEGTARDKIQEQFDVNVFGVMNVTRAILPHFRSHHSGTIVNVSSGAGVFGLPLISLYSASKFALEGWSESISYELAAVGVRMKIVEPGGVTSTGFGGRSGAEAGAVSMPADYTSFFNATAVKFEELRNQPLSTPEHVAEVIFNASIDDTDQLRYLATDDIKPMVVARRESSETAYMEFMRDKFGVDTCNGCES